MTKRTKLFLVFAFFWGLFIFWNSSMNGQASSLMSNSVIGTLPGWVQSLCGNLSGEVTFVRKSAHFIEYFVFGVLIAECFLSCGALRLKNAGNVLFPCLVWAAADEFLQTFVSGRNGKIPDVWLDFAGAIGGILLIVLIRSIREKRGKHE